MLSQTCREAKLAKLKLHPILQCLVFLLILIISSTAIEFVLTFPMIYYVINSDAFRAMITSGSIRDIYKTALEILSQMPDWLMILQLFTTAFETLFAILYCTKIEKRSLRSMGFTKKHFFARYGVGFAIGGGMISCCVLLSCLFGFSSLRVSASVSWLLLTLYLLGYVVQGMAEEVLFRGYLMISLSNRLPFAAAAAISSIIFSMAHLGNPGITWLSLLNIALFGLFLAFYIFYTDNIIGAFAIHTAWNFFEGHVFGVSVSGLPSGTSLLVASDTAASSFSNGGSFGPEGGWVSTIVEATAVAIIVILLLRKKKAQQTQLPSPIV